MKLQKLATTFGGFKLDTLLDISAMAGRLGIEGPKVADFARDISLITVALDDIPAEEAATSIARILNVFQIGQEQARNFASALNKLDDSSSATGREILNITRRISGSAAVLGLAPQKVLALATALKDAGASNEVAGTAMSQVLSRMAGHAQNFAAVAGMSMQRFSRIMRADPLQALVAFEKGLSRLDGATQMQVLEQLGLDGTRVKTTLLQLSSVIDKIPGYVRTANSEWKSLNSLLYENKIKGETTDAQLDRLHSSFQVMGATIGNIFLPAIKAVANAFTNLNVGIAQFYEKNKESTANLGESIAAWIKDVPLLFTHTQDVADLFWLNLTEKADQAGAVFDRLGAQVQANFTAIGDNVLTVIGNTLSAIGEPIVANLSIHLRNTAVLVRNAIGTLGPQNEANVGAIALNSVMLVQNAFTGLLPTLTSLFFQIGQIGGHGLVKAFVTVLGKTLGGGLQFLPGFRDIIEKTLAGISKTIDDATPEFQLDLRGFTEAKLKRGMVAAPGFDLGALGQGLQAAPGFDFGGLKGRLGAGVQGLPGFDLDRRRLFGGLPGLGADEEARRTAIQDRLAQERKVQAEQAEREKAGLLPAPEVNPFAEMGRVRLGRERAAALTRGRKAAAEEARLRAEQQRALGTKKGQTDLFVAEMVGGAVGYESPYYEKNFLPGQIGKSMRQQEEERTRLRQIRQAQAEDAAEARRGGGRGRAAGAEAAARAQAEGMVPRRAVPRVRPPAEEGGGGEGLAGEVVSTNDAILGAMRNVVGGEASLKGDFARQRAEAAQIGGKVAQLMGRGDPMQSTALNYG